MRCAAALSRGYKRNWIRLTGAATAGTGTIWVNASPSFRWVRTINGTPITFGWRNREPSAVLYSRGTSFGSTTTVTTRESQGVPA